MRFDPIWINALMIEAFQPFKSPYLINGSWDGGQSFSLQATPEIFHVLAVIVDLLQHSELLSDRVDIARLLGNGCTQNGTGDGEQD